MNTDQSAADHQRGQNFNNQDYRLTEDQQEGSAHRQFKRRRLETNPLKIGNILENIFSFLDPDSVKAARLVNPLWSLEGAKILIKRCFVSIPKELKFLLPESSSNKTISSDGEFERFLSYKSSHFTKIPNITIQEIGDVRLWKLFGALGPQVKSLKLTCIDQKAELLRDLLNLLPNLQFLSFKGMDVFRFSAKKNYIISVLQSVMSMAPKDRRTLVISRMILKPDSVEELQEIARVSNCNLIQFEELEITIKPSLFQNIRRSKTEITNVMRLIFFKESKYPQKVASGTL